MKALLVLVMLSLLMGSSREAEVDDLWLLLSSYEDISISNKDLAFFLATHGYDAQPQESYVTAKMADGTEVYLTPNGGAARLADMWIPPPAEKVGPVQAIPKEAISVNATYQRSENIDFLKAACRHVIFPVAPLGMCYDGSQRLASIYETFGYDVVYMYDPSGFDFQGHLWVLVEEDHLNDGWR